MMPLVNEESRTHEGEQTVQRRAGEHRPNRGSPMFGPDVHPTFVNLIRSQAMVAIGCADDNQEVWATLLTGAAGFANPVGDTSIEFGSLPSVVDPLAGAFEVARPSGALFLDTATLRRVRANGQVWRHGDRLVMQTEQVFRNCTKYINQRVLAAPAKPEEPTRTDGVELTSAQQSWIAGSDTFFIASYSPKHGADVNHRGGRPGFVIPQGGRRLKWPDYPGNSFYMTFGNLELNPACGLCFVDWERGRTLHLTGQASVDWGNDKEADPTRFVHFDVSRVAEVRNATALRWTLIDYSASTPKPKESNQ